MIGDTIRGIIDLLMMRKQEKKLDAEIKKSALDAQKAALDIEKLPMEIEKARLDLEKARKGEERNVGIIHPDQITLDEIFQYDPRTSRILRAADEFAKSGQIRRFGLVTSFANEQEYARDMAMGIFGHMRKPVVCLAYSKESRDAAAALWAEMVSALCRVNIYHVDTHPRDAWRRDGHINALICIVSANSTRQPALWDLMNSAHAAGVTVIPVFDDEEGGRVDRNFSGLPEAVLALARCPAYVRYGRGFRIQPPLF